MARRHALIVGLRLALHHGRLGRFTLTPSECRAAHHHIARLEAELAAMEG